MEIAWLLVVTGWAILFALLVAAPGVVGRFWDWSRGLPMWAQVIEWIVLLPWMLATAVWHSDWATNARIGVIAALAAGWIISSLPGIGI
jgi:hypothetical protein